jgi:hypothetical protein
MFGKLGHDSLLMHKHRFAVLDVSLLLIGFSVTLGRRWMHRLPDSLRERRCGLADQVADDLGDDYLVLHGLALELSLWRE